MIPESVIKEQLAHVLETTRFEGLGERHEGKVRDSYVRHGKRIIVTTDRVSAFDRVLGCIPFKGQVLNQMAAFWFAKTEGIVRNHMLALPDPNVMVCRECEALPVEAVVRAYNTGSTTTSVWHHYKNGERNFCGNVLPDGMRKDERFPRPIFTPSTKAQMGDHDESVSKDEIVRRGLLTRERIDEVERVSLALFALGSRLVAEQGIILVDTKYEFGLLDGELVLIDEIHTPDSSRFWHADTYEELLARGEEQRKIDKEYLRTWLAQQGFRGEGPLPHIPDAIKIESARRYIEAYELITGEPFSAQPGDLTGRILEHLRRAGHGA